MNILTLPDLSIQRWKVTSSDQCDLMTRERANEILDRWRLGVEIYAPKVIRRALYVTGDLLELDEA